MSLLDESQEDQPYPEEPFTDHVEYKYATYTPQDAAPVAVHQCNVCNKIFMSFKGLQQHSIIHTDTKPYICDVCGRGFRFKSNMFEHRTVHTGYTPHVCPFCGKQFRLKGNMKKHMRVHVTNKEELEAAYRPYSRFSTRGRGLIVYGDGGGSENWPRKVSHKMVEINRRSSVVPENALVIRGSPIPFFSFGKRRSSVKLQLGKDASKWLNMICQNQLIPSRPFNEKMLRVTMRLNGPLTYSDVLTTAKPLDFEIFYCPICKCECMGREGCDHHLFASHGKEPIDMQNESNYCVKCMRKFSDPSMYLQHQSYHSRVQMMIRNRELDGGNPGVDVSQICYNLVVSELSDLVDTKNSSKSTNFEFEESKIQFRIIGSSNDPGEISLNSSNVVEINENDDDSNNNDNDGDKI